MFYHSSPAKMPFLKNACREGCLTSVQAFLQQSSIQPDTDGQECLRLAAQNGHLPIVQWLVENTPLDIHKHLSPGKTLCALIYAQKKEELKFFLEQFSVDGLKHAHRACLVAAAVNADAEIIQHFVHTQDDANIVFDYQSQNYLVDSIINFLKTSAIRPDLTRHENKVLRNAVIAEKVDFCKLLLSDSAVHKAAIEDQHELLSLSCSSGNIELTQYLIEALQVTDLTVDNQRYLKQALHARALPIIKFLVEESGANFDLSQQGSRVLVHSIRRQLPAITTFFLEEATNPPRFPYSLFENLQQSLSTTKKEQYSRLANADDFIFRLLEDLKRIQLASPEFEKALRKQFLNDTGISKLFAMNLHTDLTSSQLYEYILADSKKPSQKSRI